MSYYLYVWVIVGSFSCTILATETERKISREELTHIQKDIESEFGTLKKLMDIKEKADKKRKVLVYGV